MMQIQTALTQLNRGEFRSLQCAGDQAARVVIEVLAARFQKRNGDGTWFVPQIAESVMLPPYYQVIALHPQTLWHFEKRDFLTDGILAALSATLRRPVRAITQLPAAGGGRVSGIAYVISLTDTPAADAMRLPKVAPLNFTEHALTDSGKIRAPLGISPRGDIWKQLPDIGHALIIGATGMGKSTFLHSALTALLTANQPRTLRIALIDPKASEFAVWSRAPHLFGERATTQKGSADLLRALIEEMDRRGKLLEGALCRDLRSYNARAAEPLPYILIVVDECLDMVLSANGRSGLLNNLQSIAVRGRSAGIVLWAATQHASAVDGLPRVVNVNLMTRFVFRVADANAARSAGCPGAQDLPATIPGRMLARLDAAPVPMQGYYLSDAALDAAARNIVTESATESAEVTLNEREHAIIERALQNDGYISLADLTAFGMGHREARRRLAVWQQRGWLVKDARHQNKRRLAAEFMTVWQSGRFGAFGSLAAKVPNTLPSLSARGGKT